MPIPLLHDVDRQPAVLPTRSGFTLVEMLVVSSVIIALMAIGFPVLFRAKADAAKTGTINLVEGIAAAVATYGSRSWTWTDGGATRTALLWDLNAALVDPEQAGEIDGNPAFGEAMDPAIEASGYTGLLDMAQPPVPPNFVNAKRQVIDAWGNPLRISYPDPSGMSETQARQELLRYGSAGFRVWSLGPDGRAGTADDIHHGEQHDED